MYKYLIATESCTVLAYGYLYILYICISLGLRWVEDGALNPGGRPEGGGYCGNTSGAMRVRLVVLLRWVLLVFGGVGMGSVRTGWGAFVLPCFGVFCADITEDQRHHCGTFLCCTC